MVGIYVDLIMDGRSETDRALLDRTRAGDAFAFGEFYGRRHGAVLAFLRPRVKDSELAADLMCETFACALMVVHDRERELPHVPIAWLLTIARNEMLDALRRGAVAEGARRRLCLQRLVLDDEDLAAIDKFAGESDLLRTLASELSVEQFQALKARVFDERDYPDIAAELGCSQAVVRKRVSRALTILRVNRGAQS
ncbi:MAG: RNA polymerase sigma factor [Solirubrobacteraceae bacterium]